MNHLNPMWLAALGSLLRWVLALGAGYLVRLGVWDAADAASYVTTLSAALALAGVSLALSLWQKYETRRTLMVALTTTTRLTEREAADRAAAGQAPSVATPVDRIPEPTTHG